MEPDRLTKEMIERPEIWRLYIRISRQAADVMLYNPIEDNSLIYRQMELDGSDRDAYLASLESVIYDNPLLLSDFAKTAVVIESDSFLLLPECVTDTELQEKLLKKAHPDYDPATSEMVIDNIPQLHSRMIFAIDGKLAGFLSRALVNPVIYHHQTPLLRYFADRRRHGNNAKMFVHLRKDSLDVAVYGNEGLRLANTYRIATVEDAVYYILCVRSSLELDPRTDELFISGAPNLRRQIIDNLRRFIEHVMPVIFPGVMFRAGKNALSVPFDLIVVPLCES